MLIKTLDLHHYSICPRKYFSEVNKVKYNSPARDVMKRIVLTKALGRESKWTIKGVASVWDNMFWKDKPISQENVDTSVKGSISLKKLFNRLPDVYDAHSSKHLTAAIDSSIYIQSSSDFMTVSERGVELWIYSKGKLSDFRRSIICAAELYILKNTVRKSYLEDYGYSLDITNSKNIFLVFYYAGSQSLNPTWFRVKCQSNNPAVISLSTQLSNGVNYCVPSEHCKECRVNC